MARFDLEIDWDLLSQQKRFLIRLYFDNKKERKNIEGIISMIDDIQDQAHEQGEPVVWLSENKESI